VSQPATAAGATSTSAIQSTNTDLTDPLPKQGPVAKLDIGALRVGLVQSTHKAIPVSRVPVVVEPINLQPTQVSGVSSVSETPTLPLPSSIADSAEKHSAQVLREAPATDSSVVRDQFSQLSKTLSEALGQRIVAQLARGQWRVEMQLHPTNLGRVEIHLEMKNGELEANFYTANQITRELINEGLPRLRHALEQQGMETAYRGLEQGNQGKSNGNSTGQDNPREQHVQAPSVESSTEPTTDSKAPDGLDILI
jgi:flagellar hook-length control protein FliK